MNAQMLAAVRAFRRLLYVHRAFFERAINGVESDAVLGQDALAAEFAAFQFRMQLAELVARRFGCSVGKLDLATIENQWITHERMLQVFRARERARALEPDPIRDAIDRACVCVMLDVDASPFVDALRDADAQIDQPEHQYWRDEQEHEHARLEVVAVLCTTCRTELAFPGDECGLCRPIEPRLDS